MPEEDSSVYYDRIVEMLGKEGVDVTRGSVKTKYNQIKNTLEHDIDQYPGMKVSTDKKVGEFSWREAVTMVKASQTFKKKHKASQSTAEWKLKTDRPIHVMVLGDAQIGCIGVDYDAFLEFTDIIMKTENLYVFLVGDMFQMSINRRSIAEIIGGSALTPEEQMHFAEDWLKEVKHKVICSTWDNHTDMRQEKVIGYSHLAAIYKKHCIYFSTIGHLDLVLNDITYKIALSHRFAGKSLYNKAHAPIRYLREKWNEGDIAIQGDYHQPGILDQQYGGKDIIGVVCGSIQTDSSYIKRHFSLKTYPYMPIITFHHDKKLIVPYKNYDRWAARLD